MDGFIRNMMALIGAISLVGLFKGVINIHEDILFVVEALQNGTRPIWSAVLSPVPFEIPNIVLDYMTMGLVTAGMRLRTTLYMWRSVQEGIWSEVIFIIPLTKIRITAYREDGNKFWKYIVPLRLLTTFFFWPRRIFISGIQFLTGRWRFNYDGYVWASAEMEQISKKQYTIFFETLTWSFIIILLSYALFLYPRLDF